jgi:hypothetical protein
MILLDSALRRVASLLRKGETIHVVEVWRHGERWGFQAGGPLPLDADTSERLRDAVLRRADVGLSPFVAIHAVMPDGSSMRQTLFEARGSASTISWVRGAVFRGRGVGNGPIGESEAPLVLVSEDHRAIFRDASGSGEEA